MTTVQLNKTLRTVHSLLLHGPPRRDSPAAAGVGVWTQSGYSDALLLSAAAARAKKNQPLQTGPVVRRPVCHVGKPLIENRSR